MSLAWEPHKVDQHEGEIVGQTHLLQMQGHPPARRGPDSVRESQTQAAARLTVGTR